MKSVQASRKGKNTLDSFLKSTLVVLLNTLEKKLQPILHELLTSKKKWMGNKITQ